MTRNERIDLQMQMLRPLTRRLPGVLILIVGMALMVREVDAEHRFWLIPLIALGFVGLIAIALWADLRWTRLYQGKKLDQQIPRWPIQVRYAIGPEELVAHGELGDRTTLAHRQIQRVRGVGAFLVLEYSGLITLQLRHQLLPPDAIAALRSGVPPQVEWPDVDA